MKDEKPIRSNWLIVLGCIQSELEIGYEMMRHITRPGFYEGGLEDIHQPLSALEKRGWISPLPHIYRRHLTIKPYALTSLGKSMLNRALAAPIQGFAAQQADLVPWRVELGEHVPLDVTLGMIDGHLEELLLTRKKQRQRSEGQLPDVYEEMVDAWSRRYLDARIAWCQDVIDQLLELRHQ